jgi:hypothetical protein
LTYVTLRCRDGSSLKLKDNGIGKGFG